MKVFQQKGSTGFLTKLSDQLIFIAFLLEPAIEELLVDYKVRDAEKYKVEHE